MVQSAVLGFPRIGDKRQVKKALESYWAGKIDAAELQKVAAETRLARWETIKNAGVDVIPSGDFTLYDHSLDFSTTFNVIPAKYAEAKISELDRYFAMGRGRQIGDVDLPAQEMQKWFDSNYHYIKGEVSSKTDFKLVNTKPVDEFLEAKAAGIVTRPVLLGPITYLLLGKTGRDETSATFQPIDVLDKLVPVFGELLAKLEAAGATAVQIDEPALVLDATTNLGPEFEKTYAALAKAAPGLKITLATYFGRLESNVDYVAKLPIDTLHIDLDRAAEQFDAVLAALKDTKINLSLGLVSGRNIWKNDFAASIAQAEKAVAALGADRVVVATSSSLLHTPVTLKSESKLKPEVADWFSFAAEKAVEVATIAKAVTDKESVKAALEENAKSIKARRDFEKQSDSSVRDRLAAVTPEMYKRQNPYPTRKEAQAKVYDLPAFPTTTIGSFPQTKEIRVARAKLGKGEITEADYDKFIENEIKSVVDIQEEIGLDVLVHGEPERNDMVQYFGERLTGFVFTENAWVQSYGSRYVRPPIVVSDVSRPEAMTVRWSSYAQSLSKRPVKGMLTGPVTILNWSFPRADVTKEIQSRQLALALRDEVIDLEKAGIFAIQVDEPAIREGLPLRQVDWDGYLTWAVDSFRLATAGVKDSTQTHSHFCYSDFNAIFAHIIALDADVISIEASKSDLKLLEVFKTHNYPNAIGPGLYDIHSPRVPSAEEMQNKIADLLKAIPQAKDIVVNPDCGLKTRGWPETKASLVNLVAAAKWAREKYPQN
ncbi:cobalamin-independent methionine synthase [Meredithblackwellia eburnea MCA 4105]